MTKLTDRKLSALGRAGLLLAAILWGISFVVMKDMLDNMPPLYILAIRFLGAALVLLPVCARKLRKLDRRYMLGGALMGTALAVAYVFQTYGLEHTTPGKNAFLTSTYCVIVPFLGWAVAGKRPNKRNIAAAVICAVGMAFISLEGDLTVGIGDALTVVCGFFFASHIIIASRYIGGRDTILLTTVQFAVAGVLVLAGALILETPPSAVSAGTVYGMIYLTIVCTAICILLQVFGQKYTPPSQAAVIMTLEAVFGALSSVLLMHEMLTPKLVIGFAFTFAAVILSETRLGTLKRQGA